MGHMLNGWKQESKLDLSNGSLATFGILDCLRKRSGANWSSEHHRTVGLLEPGRNVSRISHLRLVCRSPRTQACFPAVPVLRGGDRSYLRASEKPNTSSRPGSCCCILRNGLLFGVRDYRERNLPNRNSRSRPWLYLQRSSHAQRYFTLCDRPHRASARSGLGLLLLRCRFSHIRTHLDTIARDKRKNAEITRSRTTNSAQAATSGVSWSVVTLTDNTPPVRIASRSKVKGPIRCHKCQLKCRDAEHYLSHECNPAPAPDCSPFPGLTVSLKGIP